MILEGNSNQDFQTEKLESVDERAAENLLALQYQGVLDV